MWGKYSAQTGWMLNCLKSQQQPSVQAYSSPTVKALIQNQAVTWHATADISGKKRLKTIFFPIQNEGVYEVLNHAEHGGHKLVFSDAGKLRYKTIQPTQLVAIYRCILECIITAKFRYFSGEQSILPRFFSISSKSQRQRFFIKRCISQRS